MSLSMHTPSRDDDQQTFASSTGQIFFSSVPNGVFNLLSSFTEMKEFGRFHQVIRSNKQCSALWERNIRQYAHHAGPLFSVFTSKEVLRWALFVRNIDVRGWELHLRDPWSSGNETKYLSHGGNVFQARRAGEPDIVKAMVERTQMNFGARDNKCCHCTMQQRMITSLWCNICVSRELPRRRGLEMA